MTRRKYQTNIHRQENIRASTHNIISPKPNKRKTKEKQRPQNNNPKQY
jgi:hypothetical protein